MLFNNFHIRPCPKYFVFPVTSPKNLGSIGRGKPFFTQKILVSRAFYYGSYKMSKACLASKQLTTDRVDGRQSRFAEF